MPKAVDWDALQDLFKPTRPNAIEADAPLSRSADTTIYNGEQMPRWLARDLMQERAAILEFEAGMNRARAEAEAFDGMV